jgi:hypothetical protein
MPNLLCHNISVGLLALLPKLFFARNAEITKLGPNMTEMVRAVVPKCQNSPQFQHFICTFWMCRNAKRWRNAEIMPTLAIS